MSHSSGLLGILIMESDVDCYYSPYPQWTAEELDECNCKFARMPPPKLR